MDFPAGTHYIDKTIHLQPRESVVGDGSSLTTLIWTGDDDMSGALVVEMVVKGERIVVTDAGLLRDRMKKYATAWGEGRAVRARFEPEDEAWQFGAAKHLYGHLYAPVSRRTGETVADVHLRMKCAYMPDDGRTSLTQLNREEMKAYIEAVEQDIRETDPDSWQDCTAAMMLFEGRY